MNLVFLIKAQECKELCLDKVMSEHIHLSGIVQKKPLYLK